MTPESSSLQSRFKEFQAAFRSDVANDAIRPLSEYLARFRGADAEISREYRAASARLLSTEAPESDGFSENQIGPYRIVKEIGRGGQGIVYLAEDTRLHRRVALKVLQGMSGLSEEALARFRREAEAASRLDHPGICAVYDAAFDGHVPYIAMRYVEGESLAAKIAGVKGSGPSGDTSFVRLSDGPQAPAEPTRPGTDPSATPSGPTTRAEVMRVLHIIEKVARAVHAAHEAGVIHRDMKPGNVIITSEAEPVVMDFGLAHLDGSDLPTLTRTGEFMGTPAYMSPEQLLAQRIRLDRRTDVWSLGVMLYECVTLQRPFEAPTRDGLYQAIQTKEPIDPRRRNRSISSDVRVVIATALEKDRDRRYQTALDLAEELRCIRENRPIRARPISRFVRLFRWSQRNKAVAVSAIWILAALYLALAGVLGFGGLKNGFLSGLRSQLFTMLSVDKEALRIWEDSRCRSAEELAARPGVKEAAAQIVMASGASAESSPAAYALSVALGERLSEPGFEGYVLLDATARILASDLIASVGKRLPPRQASRIGSVLEGRTTLLPLFVIDAAPGAGGEGAVIMLVAAPVGPTPPSAVLGFRISIARDFARVLAAARPGITGETYAFDREGRLLSESRFEDHLRGTGLLAPGRRSTLNVEIRDPGGDILEGFRPQLPVRSRPLTRMAEAAIKDGSGVDVEGYRGYRGVPVVGAWEWIPDLDFGVAHEMDVSEAYHVLNLQKMIIWALLGAAMLGGALLVLALVVKWLGKNAAGKILNRHG